MQSIYGQGKAVLYTYICIFIYARMHIYIYTAFSFCLEEGEESARMNMWSRRENGCSPPSHGFRLPRQLPEPRVTHPVFIAPASLLPTFLCVSGWRKRCKIQAEVQNHPLQDPGLEGDSPALMDKPDIRFVFQSFASLKGEKLPKPALFRTRESLLCLENLKRGSLLVNWD